MTEEKRRHQILIAARRLLFHYGVGKTTIADIAKEASIGVGTVYLEFSSKDDIIEELATRRHARILDYLGEAAASGESHPERLRNFLSARVRAFLEMADGGTHAYELVHCACPGVQRAWNQFVEDERSMLVGLLEEGTEKGELDVDDPEATATAIFQAYRSFSPPWIFEYPPDEMEENLTRMHTLIIDGLRKREG